MFNRLAKALQSKLKKDRQDAESEEELDLDNVEEVAIKDACDM